MEKITPQQETKNNGRNSELNRFVSGAGIALFGKLGGRGANLLTQIILARFLGPAVFGVYALGWTILRILSLVAPLGLHNSVIRFAPMYHDKSPQRFRSVITIASLNAFLSGSLIGLILFVFAGYIGTVFQAPSLKIVLQILAFALPILSLLRVVASATRITQKMQFAILSEDIGQNFLNLVFVLTFLFLGWGLVGAVWSLLLAGSLACLLAGYFLIKLFPKIKKIRLDYSPQIARELLAFGIPTMLTTLLTTSIVWIDRLFIGYFGSTVDVGIYQAISQSSVLFSVILNGMNTVFAPLISKLYHEERINQLEEMFRISTKWGLYLSMPLFVIIVFASQEFVTALFGAEYIDGSMPLVILTVGQFVNVASGGVGFLLMMTGRQNLWLSISLTIIIVNAVLNVILIPSFGLIGAALATSISYSMLFSIAIIQVKRQLNLFAYDKRYFKGLAAFFTAMVIAIVVSSLPIKEPILLLLCVSIAVICVFVLVLASLGLESEDKAIFIQIFNRVDTVDGTTRKN